MGITPCHEAGNAVVLVCFSTGKPEVEEYFLEKQEVFIERGK